MRRPLLALALLALAGLGWAQTLAAEASAGWHAAPEAHLALSNVAFGDGRLALSLWGGPASPAGVALELRQTESFGVLGNLILRGSGRFDSAGGFETRLGAEGVVGPVAASLALSLFGRPPRAPDPWAKGGERLLAPEASDLGLGLELSASYRAARNLILVAAPRFYLTAARGFGLEASAEARLLRLIGPDDLRLLAAGQLAPSPSAGYAALGLEVDLNRPAWPSVRGRAWLGAGSAGLWPGAGLELSGAAGEGRYRLAAEAEPYRSDLAPLRASASFETPLAAGSLTAALEARLGGVAPAARATLGYQRSF